MSFRALRAGGVFSVLTWLVAFATPAAAQQFVDDTSSRFPNPNPTDYTNQLTIGDLDNDGDLDIIFANGGNFGSAGTPEVQRVYINNGNGVFTDQSSSRLGFSGLCRGAELGDIDNDGDLDLIFAQDFNRRPNLFLNNGAGFFTNVTSARLPAINLSSSRANFADIDNDGDLDLYFVNGGTTNRFGCGQFKIYVNNGLGFFSDQSAARHPAGPFCEPMDCIFADIDGDFDLDIRTAARGTNNSKLFRNDGTGVFEIATGIPGDNTCYSYDFGDMNGDGDLDLLGANAGPSNTEMLLANDGTGTFTNVSNQLQTNPTVDDNDSKFFDYDNDGDFDIIIAALNGPERIYTNNGAGTFTAASNVITPVTDSSLDVKVADVDNDGSVDIVTAQGESGNFQNRIYINFGPADTIPPRIVAMEQLPDTTDTVGPYVVRAAVLDGMTSDRNFFDKGVFLNYTINGGAPRRVPMRYSGGQIYRGVIPSQPCGGAIQYYVTAKDWANNFGAGAAKSFHITESGPLRFVFGGDGHAPNLIPPCASLTFQVDIQPCAEEFQPGTAVLHYQYGQQAQSVPMTPVNVSLQEATLPATTCGVEASYFISALTLTGQTVYFPAGAPAVPQPLAVGVLEQQPVFTEDFESGLPANWTASQLWGVTGACSVSPVCQGSAWAYYGDTENCNYDSGATDGLLTAPPIALPASSQITLTYCSTFEREAFGVTDWPTLLLDGEVIDQPALGGLASSIWENRNVNLSAHAGQTVTLAWRFNTGDAFGNNFLGWQIDDVHVSALLPACDASAARGDMNGDQAVNAGDIQLFTDAILAQSTDPEAVCPGDFTGDGQLTLADVAAFVDDLIAE